MTLYHFAGIVELNVSIPYQFGICENVLYALDCYLSALSGENRLSKWVQFTVLPTLISLTAFP